MVSPISEESPLLSSRSEKSIIKNGVSSDNPRRPRSKLVSSRYLPPSPSTSTTTTVTTSSSSAAAATSSSRRFQSAERRRPITPGLKPGNVAESSKVLFTSTRSLSVSFQGETFSLPISRAKVPISTSLRKCSTPERKRTITPLRGKVEGNGVVDHVENFRPLDQMRWPGKSRQSNPLLMSLDYSLDDSGRLDGSDLMPLKKSLIDERNRVSLAGSSRLSLGLGTAEISASGTCSLPFELTISDTDSVSSGGTSGMQEHSGRFTGPRAPVGLPRFWQETNSRLRRLQDPGSQFSPVLGPKLMKGLQPKRFPCDRPLSSPRTLASPIRGAIRPASPSRLLTPSRQNPSPSRVRNSMGENSSDAPSILSFSADLRRGKIGEHRVLDAHSLRLLYNRHLQWRFVNARADTVCLVQKRSVEKKLWNAWMTISELRRSVTVKRTKLLLLRQKLKLSSILKGQMAYLEEWAFLDREHSGSLQSASETLKASTLRLPIVGKAVADVQSLKEAIGSALDVMQAMGSSILSLLSKVEEVNFIIKDLVNITAQEHASLHQCKDFLCKVATMQVEDCSLRTHVLQLNRCQANGSSLTTRT